jgi:phytoene dehydrogenase-like protein
LNRRSFLLGAAATAATAAIPSCLRPSAPPITGELLGASYALGHRLRAGGLPAPTSERKTTVAIVGGGISGLSAGWKLAKAGVDDFEILELESECGGTSRFGDSAVSRYPWGAHYVPLPSEDARAVRELFAELGVIERHDERGNPVYKEEYLCFAPQERLFLHGRWQEGLLPIVGAKRSDLDEYARFQELVAHYRSLRGADGLKAFTTPMELSSRDPELHALDGRSMATFLEERGFRSPLLRWYVDYACRDDFGCRAADVSAWAGIHYFASRGGDESAIVTWPEGNGWLAARLRERLAARIRTDMLVFRVAGDGTVDAYDARDDRSVRIRADQVIFAAPKHVAPFVCEALPDRRVAADREFQYAPWLVANLELASFPEERRGAAISWDNVIYDSDSLGYVVATHQSLRTHLDRTVFTYYYPLTGPPDRERQRLLDTPWQTWAEAILHDLEKPHPDIRRIVRRIDVFRWGHAMVRPRTTFVWGEARARAAEPFGRVAFAHSDLSGFALFEEAQYRGVAAAEHALAGLGVRHASSL